MIGTSGGYSGTPLARKLGIVAGRHIVPLGAPDGYRVLLDPLPEGVVFEAEVTLETDIVHLFADRMIVLVATLTELRERIRPDAAVWVSWPKKAAKVTTDVTEDAIREFALPLGFVDVKVCAVDAIWSGLKLVVRKELR
jgi:hypothetical protein